MNILLTGATGFIGQALASEFLKESGNNVSALLRKYSENFPIKLKQIVAGDLAEFTNADVCFKGVDVIVHSAARAHIINEISSDPLNEFRKINRDATLRLAKLAAEAGVKRFVFLSSIGVNGNNSIKPFSESDDPEPHDLYAISKFEAEQDLLVLAEETIMEVVIVRPTLVYGPNAPGNFGSLIKWINKGIPLPFGYIHNQRSLVALENLVDFITLCVDRKRSPKAANQVFLISDGEDVSTTELLRKVAKALNQQVWLIPVPVGLMTFAAKLIGKDDVANRLFGSLQVDSSKARDLLGWQPVITMDEQLKKTAESYLK